MQQVQNIHSMLKAKIGLTIKSMHLLESLLFLEFRFALVTKYIIH